MSVLGDYIRRERKNQHLTLDEVAAHAHISVPYLSELERGIKTGPPHLWQILGAILNCHDDIQCVLYAKDASDRALDEWDAARHGRY